MNIQPRKNRAVNQNVLIATVDEGKNKHYGYFRCPDGTECKAFEFWNNGRGYQEFWEHISLAVKNDGPKR